MGIKETVKENLIRLRHEHKLTQLELSEKINYSDKAISRWETGEVTPDVETLEHLAQLYEIPITAFFLSPDASLSKKDRAALKQAEKKARKAAKKASAQNAVTAKAPKPKDPARARRVALLIFALCFLWTAALSLFFILLSAELPNAFCTFIWGVPATFLTLFAFFTVRRHAVTCRVFLSLFVWTALVATYIQIMNWALFPLLFVGIPLQAIILLAPFLKKKR